MRSFAILALAAAAQAAQVSFHVIAPGGKDVKVLVNGQQTALTAADPTVPYFTGTAETGADTKYKYIVGGVQETFDRAVPTTASTLNDFFERPVTYADIPELPWPIETNPQWTRSGPKQPMFDVNYIPTVWVQGDKAQLDPLISKPVSDKYPVTVTFILANEVKTFKNVMFGIHGAGKKKNNAKQSWNMALADGDTYQNRNFFKLRHMEEDPTQIREKLYADVSRAMGTYVNEAIMIRFFINGDGFGTFNLLDDITQYSFPSAMFYAGKPPAQMGALFDGASGASFQYFPDNLGYYSWIMNPKSPEDPTAVGPLCELWNKTDKANDAAIAEVDKQLDIDIFMRFLVLEYLAGHWDGYWELQTNVGLYRDPTENNRWFFIGQDFDATFGINIANPDPNFIDWSYKRYPPAFPGAVMINGLLQNPAKQKLFETYLTNTVKVLFNNVTLTNRILKYHAFIQPDVAWDRKIVQRSPGINFGWTFEQTTQNLWEWVPAPNNNGGGAAWGLIQWISRKADSVAKEFSITITNVPVGPPVNNTKPPTTNPGAGGSGSLPGSSGGNGNGVNDKNAAGSIVPQALATLALVGASLVAALA
ncbi:coth protein-domain-containing protein [Mortierella sp. GBAus27b]|nr:hypothetical protein BGX31_008183 [Mortierella sp. GBA43]KAI8353838.1 coth protein-domain-containing protein [Mortierella sp. GBAus27b]